MTLFSPRQQQTLAVAFMDVHDKMTHMEGLIAQSERSTAFARYFADLTPDERRVIEDHFMQIRTVSQSLLAANRIAVDVTPVSLRWALETGLVYLQVAVEEMSPQRLRGYGALTPEGEAAALAIKQELGRLVSQALAYLRHTRSGTVAADGATP